MKLCREVWESCVGKSCRKRLLNKSNVISKRVFRCIVISAIYASCASAAAPVEEIATGAERSSGYTGTPPTTSSATAVVSNDPYYQLQLLREEIRQLRGKLEEQGHQLELLKQRQQEDYVDLDRRLTSANSPPVVGAGSVPPARFPGATSGNRSSVAQPPGGNSRVEKRGVEKSGVEQSGIKTAVRSAQLAEDQTQQKAAYNNAYGLLKARKIPEARVALQRYVKDYPHGSYAANAYYWLGEVYLLENDLPAATKAFQTVVEQYPAHRKVNDATFKLGKAYFLQNQPAKAKKYLEQVASTSGSAARLARDYLESHF